MQLAVKKKEKADEKNLAWMPKSYLITDTDECKKKRSDSVAENIIEKFYMPFVRKHGYQHKITENISVIKKDTKVSVGHNFFLCKKKLELAKLKKNLIIYNNPSNNYTYTLPNNFTIIDINVEVLSKNTYNSVVKNIITTQLGMNSNKANGSSRNATESNHIKTNASNNLFFGNY